MRAKSIARAGRNRQNLPGLPPQPPDIDSTRLLARLRRRYAVRTDRFDLLGHAYSFTRVQDPEAVLDQVIAAEAAGVPGRMPYWADLWESALGVGIWLLTPGNAPPPQNVLDLGCGMGFSGMVAASMGHAVLMADIETDALLFAALNTRHWQNHVRTRRLDWRTDRLGERFDLILGADVLYERAQWDYLEPFFHTHLAPGGTVVLGEPRRESGTVFMDWIQTRGWTMRVETVTPPGKEIRLLLLRR